MKPGRRALIIALGTNVVMLCFVSLLLEIFAFEDVPWWIILGNLPVMAVCAYCAYKAAATWPDGAPDRPST